MAPPEKIYLAIEMLNRGDMYYANLLLDTPEAGILDLGDMSKESAENWVKAFQDLMGGIDPMKIPVMYEHEKPVVYVPFGRPPTDLMFDRVTLRYASIVTAGYGMTISDIGIQVTAGGGETLAGAIRSERQTRKSGFARFKKKMKAFFDRMLPENLEYKLIDQDDEISVARGRARLADATAYSQLVNLHIFSPSEARQQMIADGLISISIPEEIPDDAEFPEATAAPQERPSMLGRPVSPSQGGQGEVRQSDLFSSKLKSLVDVEDVKIRKLIRACLEPIFIETKSALGELKGSDIDLWNDWHDEVLWGEILEEIPEFTFSSIQSADEKVKKALESDNWWRIEFGDDLIDELKEMFKSMIISRAKAKYELDYEQGEISELTLNEIITTLKDEFMDEGLMAVFIEELNKLLDELKQKLPDVLSKSIISGVRQALSSVEIASEVAGGLDISQFLGNNVIITYIRSELIHLRNKLTKEFAEKLSEKIKLLLEDVKCPLPLQQGEVARQKMRAQK